MDDILVWPFGLKNMKKHPEKTLHKLQEANLTLNEEKCEFSKPWEGYLASIIDSKGVRVNPKKVEVILEMETPKDQSGLRRLLGIVNQLSKYQPQTAGYGSPEREPCIYM